MGTDTWSNKGVPQAPALLDGAEHLIGDGRRDRHALQEAKVDREAQAPRGHGTEGALQREDCGARVVGDVHGELADLAAALAREAVGVCSAG